MADELMASKELLRTADAAKTASRACGAPVLDIKVGTAPRCPALRAGSRADGYGSRPGIPVAASTSARVSAGFWP
jgi:hypothetical protein